MKVNFNIRNHRAFHIQDFVDYVAAGVADLGLQFVLSMELVPDAVNLVLEGFDDPEMLSDVEQARRRHPDMPLLILATEVMQDGVFNSGGWVPGIVDTSLYAQTDVWSRRTECFRRVAHLADAVLCPSELLLASYADHGVSDRLHYLPLVHLDGFAATGGPPGTVAVEEDIDVVFTGVLTEHRMRQLRALERRGHSTAMLPIEAPEYIRHHFMRRAKVYLAPRHFATTRTLSKMRTYWALSHGYFCMVEAGTDPTDLDPYLRWYRSADELTAAVALTAAERHAMVAEQRAAFRANGWTNPFARILAPWLDPQPVASRSVAVDA